MSKYCKVEDVIRWINAELKFQDIPTIEVSEDCISKHDIWKIIEDNAYWVRYNENSTEKGMTLTGINQALNECPPVIPTVSEDVIGQGSGDIDWQAVTSTEQEIYAKGYEDGRKSVEVNEGEWLFEEYPDGYYHSECSICKHWFIEDAFLKSYKYCPNCGAKMRGTDDEEMQTLIIEAPDSPQEFVFTRKIVTDGDSIKIGDWEYKGVKDEKRIKKQ